MFLIGQEIIIQIQAFNRNARIGCGLGQAARE
jgi:hypothetical protein